MVLRFQLPKNKKALARENLRALICPVELGIPETPVLVVYPGRLDLVQIYKKDHFAKTCRQDVCCLRKLTVNTKQTLLTEKKAKKFLELAILLAYATETDTVDKDISDFLENHPHYIQAAYQSMQNYIKDPLPFKFTKEESKYLDKLGMQEFRQVLKPHSWWNRAISTADNIIYLLKDYNKTLHWYSNRLFTNRHHLVAVSKALCKFNKKGLSLSEMEDILKALYQRAKEDKDFNPQGLLMQYLRLITQKTGLNIFSQKQLSCSSKAVHKNASFLSIRSSDFSSRSNSDASQRSLYLSDLENEKPSIAPI